MVAKACKYVNLFVTREAKHPSICAAWLLKAAIMQSFNRLRYFMLRA